jgi:hypothetical protein
MLFALLSALRAADPVLPSLQKSLAALSEAGFKDTPHQIPATVIDVGRLSYVPYSSFQIGEDRELNVYGNPEAPACVEIGLYRKMLTSDEEKRRCVTYLRRIFPAMDPSGLRLSGGKMLKGGVVIEVTPPDAPDAYGGWWISIYSLPMLHAAAGTSASVSVVTVTHTEATAAGEWSASDLRYAKPSSSGSVGRVYVKSYVRSDGTYVRPHSRSK